MRIYIIKDKSPSKTGVAQCHACIRQILPVPQILHNRLRHPKTMCVLWRRKFSTVTSLFYGTIGSGAALNYENFVEILKKFLTSKGICGSGRALSNSENNVPLKGHMRIMLK